MTKTKFKEGSALTVFYDKESNTKMIISINNRIRGKTAGGIRIWDDVNEKEVIQLSKTMTLKYGFLGLPIGGAKAGIRTDLEYNSKKRYEALKRIGKKLAPIFTSREFIPGFDIGTHSTDLEALLTGAGIPYRSSDWRDVTHFYTAWGMIASVEETLKLTGGSLKGKTIVIDGFGKVGSEFAVEAQRKGAKIIAITTKEGGRYLKNGFDVNELYSEFKKMGASFVNSLRAGEKIDPSKAALLNCDILVPSARFNPINSKNFSQVKAKIVCVGHNMPIDTKSKIGLHKMGVIYLPGFVANGGGVLGGQLNEYLTDAEIKDVINDSFAKKVHDALIYSIEHKLVFEDACALISKNNLARIKKIEESKTIIDRTMTFTIGRLPKKIGLYFVKNKLKSLNFI